MTLKELRKKAGLTQKACAEMIGVPYRTYIRYEGAPEYEGNFRYRQIFKALEEATRTDEEHGILSCDTIMRVAQEVFCEYGAEYAYLFGSYAKGKANEKSDVDILVATDVTGMKYFGLVEELREKLGKKVDLINIEQLNDNPDLAKEILKDGIRIYG